MTDAEYEALRDRIRAVADKWIPPLGLKWWHVDIVYDRDGEDFRAMEAPAGFESAARTHCQWAYMNGTITWNMPAVQAKSDAQLEQIFVHECMHVLLHETRAGTQCECPWDIRHEERTATMLHKAFLWTWDMAYDAGRKAGQLEGKRPKEVMVVLK